MLAYCENFSSRMGYDEALALTALTPYLSNDGSKSLNGELESWGTLGSLKLDFDADGALCYYEWYHQIGKPSCTLLNEVDRSETAQADSEAVYRAMRFVSSCVPPWDNGTMW